MAEWWKLVSAKKLNIQMILSMNDKGSTLDTIINGKEFITELAEALIR